VKAATPPLRRWDNRWPATGERVRQQTVGKRLLVAALVISVCGIGGSVFGTPVLAVGTSTACAVGQPEAVGELDGDVLATQPVTIVCARVRGAALKLVGFRLRPERSYLCLEARLGADAPGTNIHCPHEVTRRRPVSLDASKDGTHPWLVFGRMRPDLHRIYLRYRHKGRTRVREASLFRITDPALLSSIGEPQVAELTLFAGAVPHTVGRFALVARGHGGHLVATYTVGVY
jgi:hypothetical protein